MANRISKGDIVEVYKGRKVPYGTYHVHGVGDGQYGPYAHLSTERLGMGGFYRFVSQANMRKVEPPPAPEPAPEPAGMYLGSELTDDGTVVDHYCDDYGPATAPW